MAKGPGGFISGGNDPLNAPDAPTSVSGSGGLGLGSVSFTAPADAGGGEIQSYVVTLKNPSTGETTGISAASSPATVSESGTFQARVEALNIYGTSKPSEYSASFSVVLGAGIYSMGNNTYGTLGQNNIVNLSSPVQIGASNWSDIDAYDDIVGAVTQSNTLYTWGRLRFDSSGSGVGEVIRSSPVQIGALTNWSKIACGEHNMSSIKTDGTLWVWGTNPYGNLGDGTTIGKDSPVQIGSLTDWSIISKGEWYTAAIKTDGTLWTWGRNNDGQLGLNTIANKSSPSAVGSDTDWADVSAGSDHCLALKTDGTLWSWGSGIDGRTGQGDIAGRSSPTQIGALTNWSKIATGRGNGYAVKTDGTLWSWGDNDEGQLGYTSLAVSSPSIIGSDTDWTDVFGARSRESAAALKTNGESYVWGRNAVGELGLGDVTDRSTPAQIGGEWLRFTLSNGYTFGIKS